MTKILNQFMYGRKMVFWAVTLHIRRWQRYRTDVLLWIGSIWLTILAQGLFVFSAYDASDGNFFGYTFIDVAAFFGLTLVATGLAQIVIHGFIFRLAEVIWKGDFDFWILQPTPFFLRVLLEDIGLVWFWPHVITGTALLAYVLPVSQWPIAIIAAVAAAIIEAGLIITICMPAIKWGRWNPSEGLWEYFERSRSIPVGRTRNRLLLIVSFGVLQYSVALEVLTGRVSLIVLLLMAAFSVLLAWSSSIYFLRSYTSASS